MPPMADGGAPHHLPCIQLSPALNYTAVAWIRRRHVALRYCDSEFQDPAAADEDRQGKALTQPTLNAAQSPAAPGRIANQSARAEPTMLNGRLLGQGCWSRDDEIGGAAHCETSATPLSPETNISCH